MTIFRLKQIVSHARIDAKGAVHWNYDRAELIADGVVHVLGLVAGLIAATALVTLTGVFASTPTIVSVSVYVAGLLAMLGLSAAYNLWPVSPRKWLLRRFDHSAIYILIAATYTPIISQIKDQMFGLALLAGVWGVAVVGILLKLFKPGKFDKLSVGLYLALGWSGIIAYDQVIETLPTTAMWFLAIGGLLYTLGV
ncbi:hemolysin III family protein, partial [Rhodopseudomonas sp. BR0C11]|uniref:PAQR family membrane homeostasis protein TrhA n=1 Tax=Rhodopseudomonas sp. BR0C11 TaxID=2269370 RepID=UPI0013E06D6E